MELLGNRTCTKELLLCQDLCFCSRKWQCNRHVFTKHLLVFIIPFGSILLLLYKYLFYTLEEAVNASEHELMLTDDENNHRDKRQAGVGPPDPYGFRFDFIKLLGVLTY